MSFELLPPPGVTAGFHDLETLARRKMPQATQELDAIITQPKPAFPEEYGFESNPEEYAGHLATLLTARIDDDVRPGKTKLIQNAVKLGSLLGEQLLRPRFFAVSLESAIRAYENNLEGLTGFVLYGPQQYLADRPSLGALITRYKESITTDTDEQGLVSHVTGLTLIHIDMHQFDLYVQRHSRKFDSDLDALLNASNNDEPTDD